MSTSEKILFQAVDSKEAEDGSHTAHTGPLEPDDTTVTSQETSSSIKTAAATKSRWKKIFTTVAASIAYAFLNAGISVIVLFYPIVVS